jgi:hypothetical protein
MRALVVATALLATACSAPVSERAAPAEERTTTTFEDYPDAITRWVRRMASEPRPVEPSAMPPRHLDAETFPVSLVPRERIVWGGVAPDAIPAIDDPDFEQASSVDWLDDREAVLVLQHEGEPRAYPIQVLMWHEIVNDEVDGRPVAVTYCPLCNSGVAFDRTVDGRTLDFGTSGSLYLSPAPSSRCSRSRRSRGATSGRPIPMPTCCRERRATTAPTAVTRTGATTRAMSRSVASSPARWTPGRRGWRAWSGSATVTRRSQYSPSTSPRSGS